MASQPARVLIIDDDPATRQLFAANLQAARAHRSRGGRRPAWAGAGAAGAAGPRRDRRGHAACSTALVAAALRRDERTRGIPFIFHERRYHSRKRGSGPPARRHRFLPSRSTRRCSRRSSTARSAGLTRGRDDGPATRIWGCRNAEKATILRAAGQAGYCGHRRFIVSDLTVTEVSAPVVGMSTSAIEPISCFQLRDYFKRLGVTAEVAGPTLVALSTEEDPEPSSRAGSPTGRKKETARCTSRRSASPRKRPSPRTCPSRRKRSSLPPRALDRLVSARCSSTGATSRTNSCSMRSQSRRRQVTCSGSRCCAERSSTTRSLPAHCRSSSRFRTSASGGSVSTRLLPGCSRPRSARRRLRSPYASWAPVRFRWRSRIQPIAGP